jgi:hypothetical protein
MNFRKSGAALADAPPLPQLWEVLAHTHGHGAVQDEGALRALHRRHQPLRLRARDYLLKSLMMSATQGLGW